MRVVAWNVGHRTRPKAVPAPLVQALGSLAPDVLILTEYVEGLSHKAVLVALEREGLPHALITPRVEGQNQVLIAARHAMTRGPIHAPPISPATTPNLLHALVPSKGLQVIGCRIPMFTAGALRRQYWHWLKGMLRPLAGEHVALVGDLNVDPQLARMNGGHQLKALLEAGWSLASPSEGFSFFGHQGRHSRVDHGLLSSPLVLNDAQYLTSVAGMPVAGPTAEHYSDHAILKLDLSIRAN